MSRQTSTTAPDRGKTKQSRGRRRGTRNTGHHPHPAKETKRSTRWRCTNHTTNAASSTTTAAGELPNHMGRERLLPRRQHRAKQEREESEGAKARSGGEDGGRGINGRVETLAAPRLDMFASHASPSAPPVSGQNETDEHPLQPAWLASWPGQMKSPGCTPWARWLCRATQTNMR